MNQDFKIHVRITAALFGAITPIVSKGNLSLLIRKLIWGYIHLVHSVGLEKATKALITGRFKVTIDED